MCSVIGQCAGNVSVFGVSEKNQILAFKATLGCLTLAPSIPNIASLSPGSVHAFQPAPVTCTGTGFTGVNQVHVGTAVLSGSSITVLSDTQLRISPPEGLTIGQALVTATNSAGTGTGAMLTYTATSPPDLSVPPAVIGGTTLNWRFGGMPNHGYYLVGALANQTAPWNGWPLLQNWSLLAAGVLDPVGIGSFGIGVPPSILNGITVYSQMLDVDFGQLQLTGTTAVRATTIYF
jgi:hypothetical protein